LKFTGTAANVADIAQTHALLHGKERQVFADAGYLGVEKRPEMESKAQVRALVEHPFHILKNLFRHRKTRYRGLAKNSAQLHTLFALANLVIAKRTCWPKPAHELEN